MAVRTKRLWGPTTVPAAAVLLYTCPPGETAIIKCLGLVNNNVTSVQVAFYLGAAVAANGMFAVTVGGSTGILVPEIFVVLQPGDELRALTGLNPCVVTGFGAELEGVAD